MRKQALLVLLLSGFIGYSVHGLERDGVDAHSVSGERMLCAAGSEPSLSAQLSLDAGDVLVALENKHLGHTAKIKYALQIVDDTGAALAPAELIGPVGVSDVAPKYSRKHASLRPPVDGYYVVRLSTAAKGDADEHASIAEMYVKSSAGRFSVVDADEYFSKSRANAGVQR
jgi:hypothetical protein